jgi:hypothetical protein
MFTLGTKFRIINSDADFKVYDPAGAERATSAAIALGDTLKIAGFGSFLISAATMPVATVVPYSAPVLESKEYTVTVPSGISAGDAVEVYIDYKTSRYQSEIKNNYISGGRPIIFQSAILTTLTAAAIRTAIVAGFTSFKDHFHAADNIVFDVTAGTAAADIRVTAKAGYESLTINSVSIRRVATSSVEYPLIPLALNVTIATGAEGVGTGKFLEESIQMSTWGNENSYGIDTAGVKVDLRGTYTEFFFDFSAAYAKGTLGAPTAGSDLSATGVHSFAVFLNTATTGGTDEAIDDATAIAALV